MVRRKLPNDRLFKSETDLKIYDTKLVQFMEQYAPRWVHMRNIYITELGASGDKGKLNSQDKILYEKAKHSWGLL